MSVPVHHLPLPSGAVAQLRAPTAADLEVVGLDLPKLVERCFRGLDDQPLAAGALQRMRFTDYNAVASYLQGIRDPALSDLAELQRDRQGHEVVVTLPDGRTVRLDEPQIGVYHAATDYGRAGLPGGLRLLRRCVLEIDGRPASYADLAAAWPFSAPETLILHAELALLCSETAEAVSSREGRVRVVA